MTAPAVPEQPPTLSQRLPTGYVMIAIAIAAVVTAVVVIAAITSSTAFPMLERDFKVYDIAGAAVLHGVSPFDVATNDGLQFVYPPFAAMLFAIAAAVNIHVAFGVWIFGSVLALEASIWLLVKLVVPASPATSRARFTLVATVASLPTASVWLMMINGQIPLLLLILVLVDVVHEGRWQGIGVGLAAGLKLTPLLFVLYFLVTRRFRAAAVSMVTFLATVALGFAVLPGPSKQWLSGLMVDTSRMMPPGHGPWNESVEGMLAQVPAIARSPWIGLLVAVVIGVAGLAVSAWASRRGWQAAGIIGCGLTSLLVSPVSWPQDWVWLVPAIAAWLWWGRMRDNAAYVRGAVIAWLLLVASAVLTLLDSSPVADIVVRVITLSPAELLVLNVLPLLAGLGYLAVLAVTLRRTEPELVPSPAAFHPAGKVTT